MNTRIVLSLSLVVLITVLLVLPKNTLKSGELTPIEHLNYNDDALIDFNMATRFIATSDTSVQFIDVRSNGEFSEFSIPGAINIPYDSILSKAWQGYLNSDTKTNILFCNGDQLSSLAHTFLLGNEITSNKILDGGLNNLHKQVFLNDFEGQKLSARENALLLNRRIAKEIIVEYNNLPDSLRNKLLKAKLIEESELDGGCE